MKIVLTGGGTGGHAYPAICIAEALKAESPDCELLFIGSRNGFEARLADRAGIPFVGITSRQLKKLLSPGTILTAASLGKGFMEAVSALRRFGPDLVIGTGGYASAAVVMAQTLRRGNTLIHEQNVIPGRTNLALSRFASRVCVTFEDSAKYFPARKTIVTGLPIRSELLSLPDKKEARKALGLDEERFTLLVIGGSQGARRLNEVIAEAVRDLQKMDVQVVHQAGERNYEEADARRKEIGWKHYHVHPYFEDMRQVYTSTDLVLSRCGASTISEITAVGLPAILVPYPYAYADHQRFNAEFVSRNGGGILVGDSEIDAELLINIIKRLADSPEELRRMSEASRKLGKPQAARDIARLALEVKQW